MVPCIASDPRPAQRQHRAAITVLLGVILFGCGDDGSEAFSGSGGAGGAASSSAAGTTTSTTSGSTTSGSTTSGSSTTTGTNTTSAGGSGGEGGGGEGGAGEGGAVGGTGGGGGTPVVCDLEGHDIVDELGFITPDQGYFGYNGNAAETDTLVVEHWFQYGASSSPGTFTFSGENYLDCHTCAVMVVDCADVGCPRRFLVESGTLTVTTLDLDQGIYSATLTDAVAVESTIDPGTSVSTPVPGGEVWCLDDQTLEVLEFFDLGINMTKG